MTINGKWPNQPEHCLSFENPCLYEEEIEEGSRIQANKLFQPPYTLIFVGRIEEAKGVGRILEVIKQVPQEQIKELHLVGDGPQKVFYALSTNELQIPVHFHGYLSRKEVHALLKKSHFLLVPSRTLEGFPKVIAEGACYRVIPLVSNRSSIPHYVDSSNGFLWNVEIPFMALIGDAIKTDQADLLVRSFILTALAEQFTFSHYYRLLCQAVLL